MQEKNYNQLTAEESYVILQKGTEPPFVGEYTDHKAVGTYLCKQCNSPLYRSEDKFPRTVVGRVLMMRLLEL